MLMTFCSESESWETEETERMRNVRGSLKRKSYKVEKKDKRVVLVSRYRDIYRILC